MNKKILFFMSCDYSSLVVIDHYLGVTPNSRFGEKHQCFYLSCVFIYFEKYRKVLMDEQI